MTDLQATAIMPIKQHSDIAEFQSKSRLFRGNTHQHNDRLKLFAEGSMDKLEHDNYITEFFLSDVPLEFIRLDIPFLIGANGQRGRVSSITGHRTGTMSEAWLTIYWEDSKLVPAYSKHNECDKIKVDLAAYGHILKPCVDYNILKLERSKMFLERVAVN